MEALGDFDLKKQNTTTVVNGTEVVKEGWKFEYVELPNAPLYWPGPVPLKDVRDEPLCGFDGQQCQKEKKDSLKGILMNVLFFLFLFY